MYTHLILLDRPPSRNHSSHLRKNDPTFSDKEMAAESYMGKYVRI